MKDLPGVHMSHRVEWLDVRQTRRLGVSKICLPLICEGAYA